MPSIRIIVAFATLVIAITPARAQDWPTRPVTMVVPFAAGGPLDVVHARETGLVAPPTVEDLARACAWLQAHTDEAGVLGRAGEAVARAVTWDSCVERLLAAVS